METVAEMTDVAMWSLIVGFLSPILLSVIQQPKWSSGARAFVTFVWALVAAGVLVYLNGAFEGKSFVTSLLLVFVTAIATYKEFWKKTGVSPAIERGTSPSDNNRPL